jgi:hypothetical protein
MEQTKHGSIHDDDDDKLHPTNVFLNTSEKRHAERKTERMGQGGLSQNNWAIDFDSVTHFFCKDFKVIMPFHFLYNYMPDFLILK